MSEVKISEILACLPTEEEVNEDTQPSDFKEKADHLRILMQDYTPRHLTTLIVGLMGLLQESDLARAYHTSEILHEVLRERMLHAALHQLANMPGVHVFGPQEVTEVFKNLKEEADE